MTGKDPPKLASMGRRRFLENLGAFGLSATTLSYVSQETLAKQTGDLGEEVPYVALLAADHPDAVEAERDASGRAPVYWTKPYDEWVEVQAAHDAATRVGRLVDEVADSEHVRTGVRSVVDGHHRKLVVNVRYEKFEVEPGTFEEPDVPYAHVAGRLPDTVTGIVDAGTGSPEVREFDVQITRDRREKQYEYYDHEYRPIPAGCRAQDVWSADGTVGTPAWHEELGEETVVTAGHLLDSSGSNLYQPSTPDSGVGEAYEVIDGTCFDAATVDLDDEESIKYDLAEDDGSYAGNNIDGIVTWTTIENNVGDSTFRLYLQGEATGRNSGVITETNNDGQNCSWTVQIDIDSEGGDSGGPYYYESGDGETVYIAGIHAWAAASGTEAEGTAMHGIEKNMNVTVNPGGSDI